MRDHRYFIRDDDVGALTDELVYFTELFCRLGLPVSYQIIPEQLTAECAQFLLSLATEHPTLIEFGQHGLRHRMTLRGQRLNREFGPERPYGEQHADISAGYDILRSMLGDHRIRVFTPPQHKFDRSTVRAAAAVGHDVFSIASYPGTKHRAAYSLGRTLRIGSIRQHGISYHGKLRPEARVLERSVGVAIDNGGALITSAAALPRAVAQAGVSRSDIGFMLHHAFYKGGDRRAALTDIAQQLAQLGPERFELLASAAMARD